MSTYADYMARIEHENERACLILEVDVCHCAENAHHAHELFQAGRGQHVLLPKSSLFLLELCCDLVETSPHRHKVQWRLKSVKNQWPINSHLPGGQ